jgi:hypothetical protein
VVSRSKAGKSVSPSGVDAAHQGQSMVRVLAALPAMSSVLVSADDRDLFGPVRPKQVTPYHQVRDNVVTFRLRSTADSAILAENREQLTDGYRYTVVALPKDDGTGIRLRVLRDEVVPQPGKVRIRFINAAPVARNVDLAFRGAKDALFGGVDAGTEAGYKDIDPATATLEVRSDERRLQPVEVRNLRLEAGRVYTVVLIGRSPTALEVVTIEDAVSGA